MRRFEPHDAAGTATAVAEAAAEGVTLEIVGRGSRRQLGGMATADSVLDLSRLSGIVAYEPEELVLTVRPATPLADVFALLANERQHLAFEPPDLGPLWGAEPGLGTVGGMVSVGLGGSRRPFAGAPRDHLLGFKAVNGAGEAFAAGGRVVKNVTGFDLPKLVTGAYGTLGVLTELTLKVLPAPQASCTLAITGLGEAAGLTLLRQAASGAIPISGAAHLPAGIAARLPAPFGRDAGLTLVRVEGLAPVLPLIVERLRAGLDGLAHAEALDGEDAGGLWPALGGAAPFAGQAGPVWRIGCPASAAPALGEALRGAGLDLFYDWGGRLIWALGPAEAELGGGDVVRAALARIAGEGHATLVRGEAALKSRIPPFQPQSPGVAALTRRLKARFDPQGLFNPGRMDGVL
jgi:glycolate oxidase FAD binding subunit